MGRNVIDEKQKYIDLHAQLHLTDTYKSHPKGIYFPGISIRYQVDTITKLIRETESKTLLDYGCGRGLQYSEIKVHAQWDSIMPTLFDPGVSIYSKQPTGKFDGVICTDVMEHIPESATMEVLQEIYSYANKFVLLAIALDWSDTLLPNGDSVHINPKPVHWWVPILTFLKTKHPHLKVIVGFGTAKGFKYWDVKN